MNVSRTLAASAFVAVSAAPSRGRPAQAGGDPGYEIGTVTVDRTATIDADRTAIGGTYTCNGPATGSAACPSSPAAKPAADRGRDHH